MQALVRVRAPYSPALVGVGYSYARPRTKGCGCIGEESAEVFDALGMPHAALMHSRGEGEGDWPVEDWKLHLDEEEEPGKFFAALESVVATLPVEERTAVESEVDALRREHAIVREGLARGQVPSHEVARAHGAREDKLAKKYKQRLLDYARDRSARTGVGVLTAPMGFIASAPSPPEHATPAAVDKPPYLFIVGSTLVAVAAILAWRYWS